jgi:hypothetical protein
MYRESSETFSLSEREPLQSWILGNAGLRITDADQQQADQKNERARGVSLSNRA